MGDAEDPTKGDPKIFNVDSDDEDLGLFRGSGSKSGRSMEKAKLSDVAKHTLKQICSQEWVHNRCLQVSYTFFLFCFNRERKSRFQELLYSHHQSGQFWNFVPY